MAHLSLRSHGTHNCKRTRTSAFLRPGIYTALFALLLATGPSAVVAQTTIYVDADAAAGADDGTSWANAFNSLQDALAAASSGDQIWVAEGVYYPDEGTGVTDDDRSATFQLINGVEIYGGFAGNEANLADRDWVANPTILSGDIDGDDSSFAPETDSDSDPDTFSQTDHIQGSNSYHVVTGSGTDNTSVLDGFTITGGNADGDYPNSTGGGVYNNSSSPTLTNVTISGNSAKNFGGGMFNFLSGSNPSLTNVTIFANSSAGNGGGMYNESGSPTLTNVTISDNSASSFGGGIVNFSSSRPSLINVTISGNSASNGGGMYNNSSGSPTLINVTISGNSASSGGGMYNTTSSSPTLTNVAIFGNSADDNGGGMVNFDSSPTLNNVTFTGNSASNGGGIYNTFSSSPSPTLTNVILSGNTATTGPEISNSSSTPMISYSLIAGSGGSVSWNSAIGTDGGNNLDADPQFTDPDNNDYTLTTISPAINAGDNDAIPLGVTTDLAGNPRIFDGASDPDIVDIGAYEFQANTFATPDQNNVLFVDQNVSAGDGSGSSWDNAIPELRDALSWAGTNWDGDADGTLQIWVADGIYLPTGDGSTRTATFQLVNDVEIYGGFAGTEGTLGARDVAANLTILSGDIDDDDTTTEGVVIDADDISGNNTYNVVTGGGTDNTSLLDGFTITGGNANGSSSSNSYGGGIYNDGGSPNLANLTFSGNSANLYGGGMYNTESSPTQTNVTFSGNSALRGGGMYNVTDSNPSLANVAFSGNSAGDTGGGMYNVICSPTLANVTFSGNSAGGNGGGMYNVTNSNPSLANVAFSGNSAGNGGGGIYNQFSSPTLANVTFSGNSAALYGGGMNNSGGNSVLTNVTFTGNSTFGFGGQGGGMYNSGSSPTLTNVILWGNTATTGPEIFNSSATPSISYSLIAGSGGSVSWNSAIGTDGGNNLDADPIFVDSGDPDGADNIFGTSDDGLALQIGSPAINSGNPTTNLALFPGGPDNPEDLAGNPRVYNDAADIIDMGAYESQSEPFSIGPDGDNVLYVDQNVSGGDGSGSSWDDAIPELRDALTWAQGWDGTTDGTLQIWVAEGQYTPVLPGDVNSVTTAELLATFQLVDNVEIYGGFAGGEGSLGARDWTANPTILSGDIDGDDDPFAPETDSDTNPGTPSQTDHIKGNNSYHVVTGSNTAATAILDGFTITAGNADAPSFINTFGGGMYNRSGSPTLTNVTFTGNNSATNGGGMYNDDSSPILTNVTFTGNSSARSGGGMHNSNSSNPTLTNVTFTGNSAAEEGGGMFSETDSSILTNVTFIGNNAKDGGGMFLDGDSPVLTNVTFSGNSADDSGGGMYNGNGSATLTNVTFSGNNAAEEGGGMRSSGEGSPILTNVTFSGNNANLGGGMFLSNDENSPILTNVILWGNTANSGSQVYQDGSTLTVNYSIIENGSGGIVNEAGSGSSDTFDSGTGNLDADPQFTDAGDPDGADNIFGTPDDGLALKNTSPAINAGNTAANTTTTDLAGNPRVFPGTPDPDVIDMGAYEFQGEPFSISPDGNNVLYVDTNVAGGDGSGNSWANAIPELRDALSWAQGEWDGSDAPLQIWVADGTYLATDVTTDRTATFQLVNNVEVYGGFAGGGTEVLADRYWAANPTILSGDINGSGNLTGNAYSVVTGSGTNNTAVIDGFTITMGNADADIATGVVGSSPDRSGGGMHNNGGSPTLSNMTFSGNSADNGGGMFNSDNSSPVVTNSNFSGNTARDAGGGMFNFFNSLPVVTNCTFSGNLATNGGGMFNDRSSPVVTNSIFSGNSATEGGGMANLNTFAVVTNSTFTGNNASTNGGGIFNDVFSNPSVTNTIIWNNRAGGETTTVSASVFNDNNSTPVFSFSPIANSGGSGGWVSAIGTDGGNNIDADPLFVDPANGDYTLQNISPAINAGNPATDLSLFPGGPDNPEDLAGNPRVFEGLLQIIDMGAYEFQGEPYATFITTWKTDNDGESDDQSIRIPMIGNGYNFSVAWGDLTGQKYSANPGDGVVHYLEHTYSSSGTYTIEISGDFPRIYFFESGEEEKILTIEQWGTIAWSSMEYAFNGASNLTSNATDSPDLSGVSSMALMFAEATSFTGDLSTWDVSNVTEFNALFYEAPPFNSDLSDWDVSKATTLNLMFGNATSFTSDLSSWEVGNVSDMSLAFFGATAFNSDLSNWDVSSVENMGSMFSGASSFDSDLSMWDVSSVTSMFGMFSGASSFDSDLSKWNVSSVTSMAGMFSNATSFNSDLSDWDVNNVKSMNTMFQGTSFNFDLSSWDVSSVESMAGMFSNATSFNSDLSEWDVSSVTNMDSMFFGATAFNQGIGSWNVSNVTNMAGMFSGATSFDQGLGGWDVRKVTSMEIMLDNSGLSVANYDATLIGWAAQTLQNDVKLGADGLAYCTAADARQDIIDTYSWDITDGGFSCPPPTASNGRVLAANTTPYRFDGSDFNPEGLADAITIETLPSEGILQLNETDVTAGDEIPLTDINDNKLRWLPSGEYGYGYTSFDYRTSIIGDKASEDAYTMMIDLGSGFVELTGSEGWRFMSSPSAGDTYAGLLSGITVDLEFPNRQTLYELDQAGYAWDPVMSLAGEPGVGTPFIVYVVDGDLPATVISGVNWAALDGSYSYSGLDYPNAAPNPDSFFLLGNPHPIAIDFCELSSANMALTVSLWDPAAGGGNGDYIASSCAVDTEIPIAPFQAFWVRTTNANPSLEIPEAAYLNGTTTGYFKEAEPEMMASATTTGQPEQGEPAASQAGVQDNSPVVSFTVSGRDGVFTNTARLLFSGDATPELDTWDAPKLSPEGLAPKWLSFYSLDEDGRPYAIQSLPTLTGDQTRIPLDIRTTQTGTFTLDWQLPESHQLSAGYFLRVNQSGEVIELKEGSSYNFEITPGQVHKTTDDGGTSTTINLEHQTVNTQNEPRFELLITTDGSDGFAGLGDLPETFTLNQNYPNPFNPTTIISYELPQASQVRLEVYDMAGRRVATLVSGQVAAGRHTVNFDASNLSSGVYLYRLQAGSSLQTRKLTILK